MYLYTTQTKAASQTDVWVERLKRCSRALFAPARIGEGAWQQPPRLLENKWLCNTGSLSDRELRLAFQKSATVIASPHKGDTVLVYQPPVLSRQNVGDPLTKKKNFQKYVTSLLAQWASLKKHSVAKGWVGWGLAFTAELSIWPMVQYAKWVLSICGYSKKAEWWLGLQLRTNLSIYLYLNLLFFIKKQNSKVFEYQAVLIHRS